MILLDKAKILNNIANENFKNAIDINVFDKIDSTNTFLKLYNSKKKLCVCCAEQQTNGRGRLGRSWYSPYRENIYLSLSWITNEHLSKYAQLSLLIGISIIQTLKKMDVYKDVNIKWPNDIYYKNKKLAGILTEIIHNQMNESKIIVGIGINVNSDLEKLNNNLSSNWISLFNITKKLHDRNSIIADLIVNIQNNLEFFLKHGFGEFQELWKKHDYLYNKQINVNNMQQKIQGIAKGINSFGELILLTNDQKIISLKSGETTLSQI